MIFVKFVEIRIGDFKKYVFFQIFFLSSFPGVSVELYGL